MTPAPSGSVRPTVWFPDTSALVTLAVHPPRQRAVVTTLSAHRRVLVTTVVTELEELAKTTGPTSGWATAALSQLAWLGESVRVDEPTGVRLAVEVQEQIAAGRPLRRSAEH